MKTQLLLWAAIVVLATVAATAEATDVTPDPEPEPPAQQPDPEPPANNTQTGGEKDCSDAWFRKLNKRECTNKKPGSRRAITDQRVPSGKL